MRATTKYTHTSETGVKNCSGREIIMNVGREGRVGRGGGSGER